MAGKRLHIGRSPHQFAILKAAGPRRHAYLSYGVKKRTGRSRKPLWKSFASSGQGFDWKTPSFLPFITFTTVVASGHLT